MTMAGPIELPGEVAALVALDEVVVHGWDLARATGQPYDPDEAAVLACLGFAQTFEVPGDVPDDGPFGPPCPSPPTPRRSTGWPVPPAATPPGRPDLLDPGGPAISPAPGRSGTFLRGGVSERPKVHHSK